jgi:hypothetical protein
LITAFVYFVITHILKVNFSSELLKSIKKRWWMLHVIKFCISLNGNFSLCLNKDIILSNCNDH